MAQRLELTSPAFTSRAINFMNLMRDPAFQKSFHADPAGTAMREFQLNLPANAISTSNQMLATLLRDKSFSKWCHDFQTRIEAEIPALTNAKTVGELAKNAKEATAQIQREFADAVTSHLPPEYLAEIRRIGEWPRGGQIVAEDDIAILILVFVVVIVVVPALRDDVLSRNTVRLLINQLDALRAELSGQT